MFNLFFLQLSKLSSTWSVEFPNLLDLRGDCITVDIPFETIFCLSEKGVSFVYFLRKVKIGVIGSRNNIMPDKY